mgnify:CR=1 FL=1
MKKIIEFMIHAFLIGKYQQIRNNAPFNPIGLPFTKEQIWEAISNQICKSDVFVIFSGHQMEDNRQLFEKAFMEISNTLCTRTTDPSVLNGRAHYSLSVGIGGIYTELLSYEKPKDEN